MQMGPTDIGLRNQAVLKLPEDFVFVPAKESARLLRAWGNSTGDNLLGTVFPTTAENWFVVVQYDPAGYIKDDDAKDWDADELLDSLKEGTAQANEERAARHIPEMEILGWVEEPTYDPVRHRLVWSLSSKTKGAPADAEKGINYNTYALGREGYISMNLVTDLNVIEAQKPIAQALLANLEFNPGKQYADFDPATDKVAAYGLAALVGGIAAKKLGLFALIGAFLLKFGKLIVVAVIGAGAFLFKGRKKGQSQEA